MKKQEKAKEVIKCEGITFVVEPRGREKIIISRWISKPVYLSLRESFDKNNFRFYDLFMACTTLDEAKKFLVTKGKGD